MGCDSSLGNGVTPFLPLFHHGALNEASGWLVDATRWCISTRTCLVVLNIPCIVLSILTSCCSAYLKRLLYTLHPSDRSWRSPLLSFLLSIPQSETSQPLHQSTDDRDAPTVSLSQIIEKIPADCQCLAFQSEPLPTTPSPDALATTSPNAISSSAPSARRPSSMARNSSSPGSHLEARSMFTRLISSSPPSRLRMVSPSSTRGISRRRRGGSSQR